LKLKLALEDGATVDAIAFNAKDKFKFDPMKERTVGL
jgi:single-stranded-DNA-specific exonuclease